MPAEDHPQAPGGKHTDQGAAGRPSKGEAGGWEEEKVSGDRGKGGEGQAGVSRQHEPTHDSQSKTYGNPSLPRGYPGPQAQRK